MWNWSLDCKFLWAGHHPVWLYVAWHNGAGISMGDRRHCYNICINILIICLISCVISQLFRVIWTFVSFAHLKWSKGDFSGLRFRDYVDLIIQIPCTCGDFFWYSVFQTECSLNTMNLKYGKNELNENIRIASKFIISMMWELEMNVEPSWTVCWHKNSWLTAVPLFFFVSFTAFFLENLTLHERQIYMRRLFSFVHHNLNRVNWNLLKLHSILIEWAFYPNRSFLSKIKTSIFWNSKIDINRNILTV